jgi:hypothetical protein
MSIDAAPQRSPQAERRQAKPRVSEHHEPDALDKPAVAELSNEAIEEMTPEELRRLIAASEHPWAGQRLERRLAFCDRDMLVRLAFLARRCCRNQGY